MSEDEKSEFMKAIQIVSFNEMFNNMDVKKVQDIGSGKEKVKNLQSRFNGMTAVDVIKEERENKEQFTN